MRDLTTQAIWLRILQLVIPTGVVILAQTAYFLIDLYFVARLGDAAIAGVGAAGNIMFIVFAMTQVLGVGTMSLISHAVGHKDRTDALLVFNQSLVLGGVSAALTLVIGYLLAWPFMRSLCFDESAVGAGVIYLKWFLPSLGLQFVVSSMNSALMGTGNARPGMFFQLATLLLNAGLAPVLVGGWGTGHPLGVAGAGLASSMSVGVGTFFLFVYIYLFEKYVVFDFADWRPQAGTWLRLLRVGLPAGGEFALLFVFMAITYRIIRQFGPGAQAGYGVGMRVLQSMVLPALAVGIVTAPIVGQNFAAGQFSRVREAFIVSTLIATVIMVFLTVICQSRASVWLIGAFISDPKALSVGSEFLQLVSWTFVMSGVVYVSSAVFQGLGNTLPSVVSSATRLFTYVAPALWLVSAPNFKLAELWHVCIASMLGQAIVSLWLVNIQFRRKLTGISSPLA